MFLSDVIFFTYTMTQHVRKYSNKGFMIQHIRGNEGPIIHGAQQL